MILFSGRGHKRRRSFFDWLWGRSDDADRDAPDEQIVGRQRVQNIYFIISARIVDSKSHSGYRKRIYQDACRHGAMYDIRGPNPSIWYPEGSSDLQISLMFASKERAHIFLNCLIEYNVGTATLLRGKLDVSKEVVQLDCNQEGVFVHRDDYKFEDSDSPSNTFVDINKSPTEIPITFDPLQEMRSLENINQTDPGDTLYKCYIAPQAFYPDFVKDKDNIILGSHLFHTYFNGDGNRRPTGANLDWGRPPRFKIEFDAVDSNIMYAGTRYHKIYVFLTFLQPDMARALERRLREGTQAIGDLQFRSFFYTTNVENCVNYIALKKRETEMRWGEMEQL
jgi:uncharacterized protein (DUF1330 family)